MSIAQIRPEIAPHSVEAEQQLLGGFLLCLSAQNQDVQRAYDATIRLGGSALFFDPVHATIFDAIRKKEQQGGLINPVTISEALRGSDGVGDMGPGYLARLAGAAITNGAVEYVRLLSDLAQKRSLTAAINEAQAAIARGEDQASVIAGRLEASLISASISSDNSAPVSMLKALNDAIEQSLAAYRGEESDFVRSGMPSLDSIIGGFYPGELILLGGRPSMGKTAVALSMALNAARTGKGVCIASLEMNPEAMAIRAIAEQTAQLGRGMAYADIRRGQFDEAGARHLFDAHKALMALPVMFLNRTYSDIGALFSGAKQVHRAMGGNMKLLIVDYAQLLKSQAKSRYEQITEISIALKSLAGQLNIPVVALSQLSRAVEQRDDKRPQLSDLRESGQLEQDADTVLFCYRDEYYHERDKPDQDELDAYADWQAYAERVKGQLDVIVAKQRQGDIGTARMRFNAATNLIWEDGI